MCRSPRSLRWAFYLPSWRTSSSDWSQAMRRIQPEERARIRQFKYLPDAKASLAGWLMLRRAAKLATGRRNDQIEFERSDKGRPMLKASEAASEARCSWDFNVSHHGSYTVLAAEFSSEPAAKVRVGIDVMRLSDPSPRNVPEFFRLMRRKFTDSEWLEIRGSSGELSDEELSQQQQQMTSFYRHWCLKESFVKADGAGLNWDLERISFKTKTALSRDKFARDSSLSVDGKAPPGNWTFHETLLGEEEEEDQHCVAVAISSDDAPDDPPGIFDVFKGVDGLLEELEPLEEDLIEAHEWGLVQSMTEVKPF